MHSPQEQSSWVSHRVNASLDGLFGLNDEFVLARGRRTGAKPVFRWDGREWTEIAAPEFEVRAMHGTAPDCIYTVGYEGGIARWDGTAWRTIPSPTSEILVSAFVESPDEIYVVGISGSVLQGSTHGFAKIMHSPSLHAPAAVAKHLGQLYVGTGPGGLYRRVGKTDTLEHFKPKALVNSTSKMAMIDVNYSYR